MLYKILQEGVMYNSASNINHDWDLKIFIFHIYKHHRKFILIKVISRTVDDYDGIQLFDNVTAG
jgi:hypothetical protein